MLPYLAATLALAPQQSLNKDLDALLNANALKGSLVGATVLNSDGTLVYERNGNLRLVPASNQKLLTVAYALAKLGPEHRATTKIWKTSDKIIVESTGDPSLTYEQLVAARKKLGAGKSLPVYVKQPYKPGIPPSWEIDDLPNKYAAPVTAFTVDRGSFELWAEGGKAYYMPAPFGSKVTYMGGIRSRVSYDPFKRTALVYGPVPKSRKRLDTLALERPDQAAASVLGSAIYYTKQVPSTTPTVTITSPPLLEIAKECLRKSDNNYAEHLLLMAALKDGPYQEDAYEEAAERMAGFYRKNLGLEEGAVRVYDGSGLSRHNFVSSQTLADLLIWAEGQAWATGWKSSLAAPGVDGTLENRLKGIDFLGKTGTLDAVSALTGYLRTKSGEELVISLIFNNYTSKNSEIRDIADRFIRKIEESKTSGTLFDTNDSRESHSSNSRARSVRWYLHS